jgi:hypothetical protein
MAEEVVIGATAMGWTAKLALIGSVFTVIGGAIVGGYRMLFGRVDKRTAEADALEAALDLRAAAIEAKEKAYYAQIEVRFQLLEARFIKLAAAADALANYVRRTDPMSSELQAIEAVLREMHPLDLNIPAAMAATAEAVDVKLAKRRVRR